jgi:outer membrane protein TolC
MCVALVAAASGVSAEVLTLEQCINIALEKNGSADFGLPRTLLSYHQAKENVWSAWGGLLPSISHGYSYSYLKLPEGTIFDPTTGERISAPSKSSDSWSASFSLRHTLFDGGANVYRVAQAYHNRAAMAENLRSAENQLVLGVKERYFGLLKAKRLVEVQQAAVRRAEEFLKTIESRHELGSASLSEVLKAKVQLGTEQLELLRRENDVRTGTASLNSVLNRPVDTELEIADIQPEEAEVPSYPDAKETAIRQSPQMQIARADLRSAKDDIGIARASLFPTLSWGISRSFNPERRNDLLDFDGQYGTWSASASLSFSIFEGFQRKTQISNARVGVKYAKEDLNQAETSVELAVKQAYLGVELAAETRKLAEQTEASAQEDFNLAQEKYNLGAATILDLLDAQASLTKAQNDKVNALFDYLVAVAGLENAMGLGR